MKKLLIIKTDAIGDYILFRNLFEFIKKNEALHNFETTILANVLWKDLALCLDKDLFDRVIWIDLKKYGSSRFYRFFFHFHLKFVSYDMIICGVKSRRLYFEDELVKRIKCSLKIGNLIQKSITNTYYDRLINSEKLFEFDWNKEFLSKSLAIPINAELTVYDKEPLIQKDYVIFFIGASDKQKIWDLNKFASVALYLINNFNKRVVLCGSADDKVAASKIFSLTNFNQLLIDKTGTTSFCELIQMVKSSLFVLTNDTMGLHLSAGLKKTTICLYKGDDYGRFLPYPKNFDNVYVLMPQVLSSYNEDERIRKFGKGKSEISLNDISIEQVEELINKLIVTDD